MRVLLCVLAMTFLAACAGGTQRRLVTPVDSSTSFGYSYDLPDGQLAQAYAIQHCSQLGMRAYMTGTQAFYGPDDRVSTFACY